MKYAWDEQNRKINMYLVPMMTLSRHEQRTINSASIVSMRSSRTLIKAKCAISGLKSFFPFLGSGGAVAFKFSITAVYSCRVEDIVSKEHDIFQGLVDTYIRGESE